ncbi:hypothetical protein [Leeuwenhoekiella parthenopeia]|uniref:Uncharacterized protein n=1 Tax=Leeuwenhoekiella parthenopeia TaxID=2890320 RepID=A0ABS8GVS9_9FLAO|nr:hypothetical protein [Leeuwenhoekiella parthenopeia]MCC4213760.1 hypothetical protein [Leeuwenhoekiella parthenopeia]
MKLLISIISVLILSFSPITSKEANAEITNDTFVNAELTFDGYEGEYYFFTDADLQAVVLESSSELAIDLENGNYEGSRVVVAYKALDRSADSSSEGIIKSITLANDK